jgi:hypothetical protein
VQNAEGVALREGYKREIRFFHKLFHHRVEKASPTLAIGDRQM